MRRTLKLSAIAALATSCWNHPVLSDEYCGVMYGPGVDKSLLEARVWQTKSSWTRLGWGDACELLKVAGVDAASQEELDVACRAPEGKHVAACWPNPALGPYFLLNGSLEGLSHELLHYRLSKTSVGVDYEHKSPDWLALWTVER